MSIVPCYAETALEARVKQMEEQLKSDKTAREFVFWIRKMCMHVGRESTWRASL
jgi:hypothetical protein